MIILLLSCCHSGYEEKDGKIYLKWIHGGNWTKEYSLVKDADAKTFQTIKHNTNLNLGKDKNNVFKDTKILEKADPMTFEQVFEYYWKDKNNVYLLQFGGNDCIIKHADPKTFEFLKNELWSKDKNHIYFKFEKLENVNPNDFIVINKDWGKDNNFYYYNNLKLDSLDFQSAVIVSASYIKDKNNVYYQNKLVNGANTKSFKADGVGSFGHDDVNMFEWDKNKGKITEQYRRTYINNK